MASVSTSCSSTSTARQLSSLTTEPELDAPHSYIPVLTRSRMRIGTPTSYSPALLGPRFCFLAASTRSNIPLLAKHHLLPRPIQRAPSVASPSSIPTASRPSSSSRIPSLARRPPNPFPAQHDPNTERSYPSLSSHIFTPARGVSHAQSRIPITCAPSIFADRQREIARIKEKIKLYERERVELEEKRESLRPLKSLSETVIQVYKQYISMHKEAHELLMNNNETLELQHDLEETRELRSKIKRYLDDHLDDYTQAISIVNAFSSTERRILSVKDKLRFLQEELLRTI